MFQTDAAKKQTTEFPHQGKFIYNSVTGKKTGYKCNCLSVYLCTGLRLASFCYSLVSEKTGSFNNLNCRQCKDTKAVSLWANWKVRSSALLFLSSAARRRGYLKLGKPSTDWSSSLASGERGPTSASKLPDWVQKPPWCARCGTGTKFVALLLQSTLASALSQCFANTKNMHVSPTLTAHSASAAAAVHWPFNKTQNPYSFIRIHFTASTLHAWFLLDQYHAACIHPPTLLCLQTRLFPYHATWSLQSVRSVWPLNLNTKAPKHHLFQNKDDRSITTQCARSSPGMGRTQK